MPTLRLSKEQTNFILSKTKGTIYLGGLATGKSYCLVLKSILLALEGKRGLFLSYSLNNLRDNVLVLFRQVLTSLGYEEGIDYSITRSPAINVIIKGTDIMLRTAAEPDLLRGPSVSFLMFEEGRELSRKAFDVGLGRLRLGTELQWFIASTTRGKEWMYNIIKEQKLADIFDKDLNFIYNDYLTVIRAKTKDAPHLSDEYVLELERQYTSSFRLQELDANIITGDGSIIKSSWFTNNVITKGKKCRFWDLAVSIKDNADYSVGSLLVKDGKFSINNIVRVKLQWPELKKLIINTAIQDGQDCVLGLEKAGQQGGLIDDLSRSPELQGYVIRTISPTKDLITRSLPWISQAELGNISICKDAWNRDFFDECSQFSYENYNKVHDDQIASITGAYELINKSSEITVTY